MKSYSDGNFVKQCLIDIGKEMCPKMKCEKYVTVDDNEAYR